ncbi:hypothetical protein ABTE05_21255, partial [Acinetobacter baumannii]
MQGCSLEDGVESVPAVLLFRRGPYDAGIVPVRHPRCPDDSVPLCLDAAASAARHSAHEAVHVVAAQANCFV